MLSDRPERPSKAEYYLDIALAVATRSTCLRRRYGAVVVANDEIIATGYNGATLYLAGVDLETGERIPADEISPCPVCVCMRMIGDAGVDVVTSA